MDTQAAFNHPESHHEEIHIYLRDLAGKIVSKYAPRVEDPDDYRQAVYVRLAACIHKYQPGKGTAFSYFFTIAKRELFHLLAAQPPTITMGCRTEPMVVANYRDLVLPPRRPALVPDRSEVVVPLKILDAILRKTRDKAVDIADTATAQTAFVMAGLFHLQEYRRRLTGRYYPMNVGTGKFTADRWLPAD